MYRHAWLGCIALVILGLCQISPFFYGALLLPCSVLLQDGYREYASNAGRETDRDERLLAAEGVMMLGIAFAVSGVADLALGVSRLS